jgi:hypothetical protein
MKLRKEADTSSSSPSLVPSPAARRSCWLTSPRVTSIQRVVEALMQMFGELHAGGATVCLATHDPRWLARAQRHLYLSDGRIVDHPVSE